MATSLLDTLGTYLTPDIIGKASSMLGESSGDTQKAMSGILPTLLGGVTNMSSTEGGASKLMGMLQSGGFDGSILNNLGGLLSGGTRRRTCWARDSNCWAACWEIRRRRSLRPSPTSAASSHRRRHHCWH